MLTCLGFDTGNIGGILVLPSFKRDFGISGLPAAEADNRKGTIAAMLAAGGSAGALCAAPTSDFLGRKWSVFLWAIVFVVGASMQMVADYQVLIAGRFIAGLGVGAMSGMPSHCFCLDALLILKRTLIAIVPLYNGETAPKRIRGALLVMYQLQIHKSGL